MMTNAGELRSGKGHRDENFPVASRLIHPRHRDVILAFYRFARTADDIADHATARPDEKLRLLEEMRRTVLGETDAEPTAVALRAIMAARSLSPQHAVDLLVAFSRDVTKLRYGDWDELMDYCRYSAMPVGRFVLDVHGEERSAWPASDALCSALQVVNHLQDCGKDYRDLDRVYIPLDIFAASGTGPEALGEARASPALLRRDRRYRQAQCEFADAGEAFCRADSRFPSRAGSRRHSAACRGPQPPSPQPRPVVGTGASPQERGRWPRAVRGGVLFRPAALAQIAAAGHRRRTSMMQSAGMAESPAESGSLKARAQGSSFYAGMRLMPTPEREAMFAIYAFSRAVDDIADDGARARDARAAALESWRTDIEALYAGSPPPRAAFLRAAVKRYGLRKEDFLTLIDGMAMDVAEDIRGPDLATLDLYCDRVASAVGRLSIKVFDMDEGPGFALAHHLGRALQLTNILRDIDEDAAVGRLYLPHESLIEAGIESRDPHGGCCRSGHRSRLPQSRSPRA